MAKFIEYENREEWLAARKGTIGGSDIPIICGFSKYKTAVELWKEKTGRMAPVDLSGNARVQYGTMAEEPLRQLFTLKHTKEYQVEYHPFRVYYSEEYPFMTCTLDGEITRLSDGAKGVWECKTVLVQNRQTLEEWNGSSIPDDYYLQVLHQIFVYQADFVILNAELRYPSGRSEIREYSIEADSEQVQSDIANLIIPEAVKFNQYLVEDKSPPTKLVL